MPLTGTVLRVVVKLIHCALDFYVNSTCVMCFSVDLIPSNQSSRFSLVTFLRRTLSSAGTLPVHSSAVSRLNYSFSIGWGPKPFLRRLWLHALWLNVAVHLALNLFNFSHAPIILFSRRTHPLAACGNLDWIQNPACVNGSIFSPVCGLPRATESSLQTALILPPLSLLPGSPMTFSLSIVGMFWLHVTQKFSHTD